MNNKIFVLFFIVFATNICSYAYSDSDFDRLEYIKYGTVYSDEDLASRLRRLEIDSFGMSQSGDLETRIENLKKVSDASGYLKGYNIQNNSSVKKKSAIKNFFNNLSSSMSMPIMTGYTPSIDPYYNYVPNSFYNQNNGYLLRNNYYSNQNCSMNKPNRYFYDYDNRKYPNPPHNIRHSPYYNFYTPQDILTDFATRSTVHILQD